MQVPTLSVSGSNTLSKSTVVRKTKPSISRSTHQRRHSDGALQASKHVSELGAQLSFDREVVLSQCPEAIYYEDARQRVKSLCGTTGLPLKATKTRTSSFSNVESSRHDARSELKKHRLCPRFQTAPPLALIKARTAKIRLPSLKSSSSLNSLLESKAALKSVQDSQDSLQGQWEEALLFGVSQSTAARFVELARGHHKERLSEVVHRKVEREMPRPPPPTHSSPPKDLIQVNAVATVSPGTPVAMATTQGTHYITERQRGAIPVHQFGKEGAATILLSNNTRFHKVLQERYPQNPKEWISTDPPEYSQGERSNGVVVVKGHQRWTALPQRVPVGSNHNLL